MTDFTSNTAETMSDDSKPRVRRATVLDWLCLALLVAAALESATFSLISIGHIAHQAERLAASDQAITASNLAVALRPVDALLLTLVLATLAALGWLEWRRRALSRLLYEMTPISAVIILGTFVGWLGHTYLFPGVLLGGDSGSHVARFLEVRHALEAGHFPLWTNYDYLGSPLLAFTGPLTYLVGGGLDLCLRNPVLTAKVLLYSLHLASGVAFYAFLRRLGLRRVSALVATIGFSGSFAHLHLFLYRGVFPQAFTIFFLILLFYAAEGLMGSRRLRPTDWLLFALATSGLIVNHQPHALFAAFYLALFGGTSLLIGRWYVSGLRGLITAGVAGVAASAFAVLPILWEGDWVMIQPDSGLFELRLPTAVRISHLLLWHATRENWGTDYWAYLGLGLVCLAVLGLLIGLRGGLGREFQKLVCAILPCLAFLPFLYNPVVRDVIFILFFVAILASISVEFLATGGRNPRIVLVVITLIFIDVASTSVQPVARTDKQFLVDAGQFLQTSAPDDRFMEIDFFGDQGASPDVGPGAGPISAFTRVQRISGTHNMAATRVHNYAEATVERVAAHLVGDGHISPEDLRLLSVFNVTRVICFQSFSSGCPGYLPTDAEAPALGRYIAVPDASPVIFSRQLVALTPPPLLDKPMVWREDFQPDTSQVAGINRFLNQYLLAAQIEPTQRLAGAIPVRHLPVKRGDFSASQSWHPVLHSYHVGEQSVRLTLSADQPGYVQITHPWYPGTVVLDNGQPIDPMQGALDLMVLPVTSGQHTIVIMPAMTRIESISLAISLVALVLIFIAFGVLKLNERARSPTRAVDP